MSAPLPDVFATIFVSDRLMTLEERLLYTQETYGIVRTVIFGGDSPAE